jgi:autotransporter-associated beta strand protein
MKKHILNTTLIASLLLIVLSPILSAREIIKADNSDELHVGSSWVGGVAPGPEDIAVWDGEYSNRTYDLGEDVEWYGIDIRSEDPGGNLIFRAGNKITLGAGGIKSAPKRTTTFNISIDIDTDQTWEILQNTFITQGDFSLNGYTLTLLGGGTKQFKTKPQGPGTIIADAGGFKLSNGGSLASDVDVIVRNGGNFSVDKDVVSPTQNVLVNSLTLMGGRPVGITSSSKSDVEIINQNAINVCRNGQPRLSIYQQGKFHTTFWSDSLNMEPDSGSFVITGNQLGLFPADVMTNSVNVIFNNPPELSSTEGATGTTTLGVLRGVTANYDNSEYGIGLVTYDEDKGIRLLDFDTEYTHTLVDGENDGNNVRLANMGSAPFYEYITNIVDEIEVVVTNLVYESQTLTNYLTASVTSVNSLSLDVSGPNGNAGVYLAGDEGAVLRLNSGILFSRTTGLSRPVADEDLMLINIPLDFDGKQGFILNALTGGMSNGSGPALQLNVSPVNDGGEGIMFAGHGSSYLQWPAPTMFTGPVIINSGWFRITGGAGNGEIIPTRLIMYGGSVQNHGNRIADDADIEIHGGTLSQKGGATNSGSGAHETFRNLFMTGGSYSCGASGTSSGATKLDNAYMSGGTWGITRGHTVTVEGDIFLSGSAQINFSGGNDRSYRASLVMNNGTITITNSSEDVEWVPISLGNQNYEGSIPPRIIFRTLEPAVVFVGNPANTNAAVISTAEGVVNARMELNGTQVFDIGEGPGKVDLLVMTDFVDDSTNEGTLVKEGTGTMELAGSILIGGSTSINEGEIRLTGSTITPMEVAAGAVLGGSGIISNSVEFAQGSAFRVNILDEDTAEVLVVTESVTGEVDVIVPDDLPEGEQEWLVMTADSLSATFKSANPLYGVYKRNGGKELWLTRKMGNTLIIR